MVIYWYDVQKAFNRSTKCSPTLYLMAITTADCFTATRIELNSAGSVSVRHLCTVCVGVLFTLCVTKTDKCNSGEECAPPQLFLLLLIFLHCELAQPWHEDLQGSHVTRRTLTSVIRPAAIQFRANQCHQHKQWPQAQRERGRESLKRSGGRSCGQPSQTTQSRQLQY